MAKLKVLLVDDEPDFLEIMGSRIGSWEIDVIKASNGMDALDRLKTEKPDAVILDYMMPGMDGVETLKMIRRANKEIPVVMLTAHPDVRSIKGTEKLGVIAYIPKLSAHSNTQSVLKSVMDTIARRLKKDALK